jgi:hypothetical protein
MTVLFDYASLREVSIMLSKDTQIFASFHPSDKTIVMPMLEQIRLADRGIPVIFLKGVKQSAMGRRQRKVR